MEQLISKFANLGYEILGIFVPGAVLILFLFFGWWCLGPLASTWTFGFLPQAKIQALSGLLNILNEEIRAGLLVSLLIAAYFAGHLLHWAARAPKRAVAKPAWYRRIWLCLIFSVPKPEHSYEPRLEPLFNEAKSYLGFGVDAEWRQFYPVAKSYLAANLQTSLVSTYQNKYTLHRSLTAASVIWFWLSIGAVIGGVFSYRYDGTHPMWAPLAASIMGSLLLIWGFSDSYRYNWKLWGDTIITEVFMLKKSPKK